MSLTPTDVHAVRFRTALRGYSTSEVDAFLDRVATCLTRLHDEVAALRAHAPAANATQGPAAPLPRPVPGESADETSLRTLLVAQRTADQTVSDARAEADRLLADARAEVERLLGG